MLSEKIKNIITSKLGIVAPIVMDQLVQEIESELMTESVLINHDNMLTYVRINDILYAERPTRKEIYVITSEGVYQFSDKSIDFIAHLSETFENFHMVDKRLAINIKRIKKYDSNNKVVYFHESADKKYPFTVVSQKTITEVIKPLFGEDFDVRDDSVMYTQIKHRSLLTR
ncbi:hypothetical protein [Paenibacillus medicaginis]|uniref:HTH LytTR-type domain-containing protein n=1 Tax=Paenibacillus medicaginis TaxID=1470560 RepID=A0ABV5BV62_9BACL